MRLGLGLWRMLVVAGGAALLAACVAQYAQERGDATLRVSANELAGVVMGSRGPEPGVWVIAETTSLPTRFAKIVVTDDHGRYLMPELPEAEYDVWVRGYGLVDSLKVKSAPGRVLDLTAVAAPDAAAAAEYYPPIYWFSMMRVPAAHEFPAGPMKTQPEWLNS